MKKFYPRTSLKLFEAAGANGCRVIEEEVGKWMESQYEAIESDDLLLKIERSQLHICGLSEEGYPDILCIVCELWWYWEDISTEGDQPCA